MLFHRVIEKTVFLLALTTATGVSEIHSDPVFLQFQEDTVWLMMHPAFLAKNRLCFVPQQPHVILSLLVSGKHNPACLHDPVWALHIYLRHLWLILGNRALLPLSLRED